MKKEKLEYQPEVSKIQNGKYKYFVIFYGAHNTLQKQEVSQIVFLQFFGKHKVEVKNNIKHYYISYKDLCQFELDKHRYKLFSSFDSEVIKTNNINSRYIELSELTELNLFNRLLNKEDDITENIYMKEMTNELFSAIVSLNEIQKRRLVMYFYGNMTYEEIAIIEKCTKTAIKFSIDISIKKIRNKLKVFLD